MKTYHIEIGLFSYTVKAESLRHAKLLAAYQHKSQGRGRGVTASKVARLLAREKK